MYAKYGEVTAQTEMEGYGDVQVKTYVRIELWEKTQVEAEYFIHIISFSLKKVLVITISIRYFGSTCVFPPFNFHRTR